MPRAPLLYAPLHFEPGAHTLKGPIPKRASRLGTSCASLYFVSQRETPYLQKKVFAV